MSANGILGKIDKLKQNQPEQIKTVKVFWECCYKKQITKLPDYKIFLETFHKHPLKRLIPRDCSLGGLLQVFAHYWNKTEFPNEVFYSCDINGLYSHVAMIESYNVGKYEILIGKHLLAVNLKNEKFYLGDQKLYGTALVSVVAPKSILVPFLIHKGKMNSVLILCKTCYLKGSKKCNHSDSQREFTGSYFIEELELAMSLGYKVTAIHECHAYFQQKAVFKTFISILNYYKIKFSTYLEGKSDLEKNQYCDILNKKMKFEKPFLLSPKDSSNDSKKYLFKLAANSLVGKFQQRKDKSNVITITDNEDLCILITENKNEVLSIKTYHDSLCQVTIKPNPTKIKDSLHSNCYLGSQVVAYTRIYFYKQIKSVISAQGKLFYIDTDSIFLASPKMLKIHSHSLMLLEISKMFSKILITFIAWGLRNILCQAPKVSIHK